MAINTILVIGSGTMGNGIAHVAAAGGYATILNDIKQEFCDKGLATIRANFAKGVEKGKVRKEEMDAALGRILLDTDLGRAASKADFVIEAITEDMKLKCDTFARADRAAPKHAIFASNTSTMSITEMGAATTRARQFIGMHFFNPVHIMKLVEIIRGRQTDDATVAATEEVSRRMSKETVLVNESPGFVTSRMNALIGNEAFRLWEEGVATPADIDKACKLGLNHPMGPFELADLVGLDARLNNLRYLEKTLGPAFKPPKKLEELVAQGRLGKKNGKGVYDYDKSSQ